MLGRPVLKVGRPDRAEVERSRRWRVIGARLTA